MAAIVRIDDIVGFFKMHGDRGVLQAELDNFRQFVESARFAPSEETADGNN